MSWVYLAGYYDNGDTSTYNIACYWKNGVKTDLTTEESIATSIYIEGSDVYITGVLFYGYAGKTVCYWKNGVRTDVASNIGGYSKSIFVTD